VIVVIAIDALEYNLVEKFQCRNLMQTYYGKTDISEFSEPRTMVLWSSFMTGTNLEKEILALGDQGMWNARIDRERTFFSRFRSPEIIDLPGYSYDRSQHESERVFLKQFFEAESRSEKDAIRDNYNKTAFEHHKNIKSAFFQALDDSHDLVIGYFSLADVIGHLNFGNTLMMKMIYRDLDDIAGGVDAPYIVLSDHGMKAVGCFGDHSGYGFWSTPFCDLGEPRITDFSQIIMNISCDSDTVRQPFSTIIKTGCDEK